MLKQKIKQNKLYILLKIVTLESHQVEHSLSAISPMGVFLKLHLESLLYNPGGISE